ncbi:MAG: hypothetical protein ACP5D7_21075 [Limnospira sp.]
MNICDLNFVELCSSTGEVKGGIYVATDSFSFAYTGVAIAGSDAIAVGDYTATTASASTSVYNDSNYSYSFAYSEAKAVAESGYSDGVSSSNSFAIYGSFYS